MRVVVVILSMMIGAAGCARKVPETPQPTPATTDVSPPATTAPAKPSPPPPSTVTNKPEEEGSPEKPDAASEAIRVGSGRRTRCSSDAPRETCAANGYGEARADETRDACAAGEARDTAGSSSSKADDAGTARDVTQPNAGSHGVEGAAQVDESHRPHDEADAEESGGRSAGRIP